jgi:hypothetical protein
MFPSPSQKFQVKVNIQTSDEIENQNFNANSNIAQEFTKCSQCTNSKPIQSSRHKTIENLAWQHFNYPHFPNSSKNSQSKLKNHVIDEIRKQNINVSTN